MKKRMFIAALLCAIMLAPSVYAEENVWELAESEQYGKKFTGMIGRGFLNVATCFVDVIVQTVEGTQDGPPFVGTLSGLGTGIACTALRVSSGALDVATFWVPGFNGFPVSRSYSNCLEYEEEVPEPYAAPAAPVVLPAVQPPPVQPVQPPPAPPQQEEQVKDVYQYVKK